MIDQFFLYLIHLNFLEDKKVRAIRRGAIVTRCKFRHFAVEPFLRFPDGRIRAPECDVDVGDDFCNNCAVWVVTMNNATRYYFCSAHLQASKYKNILDLDNVNLPEDV